MATSPILAVVPLGFQWPMIDPFLFCAHHDDLYPRGNEHFGPAVSLAGRNLGMDFELRDGFRMYHGDVVPGFPQHPHRGFETITLVRKGYIDHSDSLGARARFGKGDVQWLTAGRGIVHSEMFPLLQQDQPNPLELFQIWLNLPAADKMTEPYFTMLWAGEQPRLSLPGVEVVVVAGELLGRKPPPPPPSSWAARAESDLGIWSIQMQPGARFTLPAAQSAETLRILYFFGGDALEVEGERQSGKSGIQVDGSREIELVVPEGAQPADLLVLQGKPIGEPVAQQGPFVMNSRQELQQAFLDYRQTQFGGWPYPSDGPVHGAEVERFALRGEVREDPRGET